MQSPSIDEQASSSKRNGAHKTPIQLHLDENICTRHRGLEAKVDRVLRTQRRHSWAMWAIGILVALVGIAIPSLTSVQVARIGHEASKLDTIERKLDALLKR